MRFYLNAIEEFGRIFMPVILGVMIGRDMHSWTLGILVMCSLSYLDPREAKHV